MKRIIALTAVAVMLLCAAGAALAEGEIDRLRENPETDQEEALGCLFDYLGYYEDAYRVMFSALDEIKAFCENRDWESLYRARVMTNAVGYALKGAALPELTLTAEQIENLVYAGVEVDYLPMEFSGVESFSDMGVQVWQSRYLDLMFSVFTGDSLVEYGTWEEMKRQMIEMDASYLMLMSNFTLLSLGDGVDGRALYEEMASEFPVLYSCGEGWYDSPDAVLAASDTLMDAYEAVGEIQNENLGISRSILSDMQENPDAFMQDRVEFSNAPLWLPLPLEVDGDSVVFAYFGADGNMIKDAATEDDVLNMLLVSRGAGRQGMQDYGEMLLDAGLNVIEAEEGDGQWLCVVSEGEIAATVSLRDEDMIVYVTSGAADFAPAWYVLQP